MERRAGRRWRRLFSCHIISDRVVNKGPLRPPGPLHRRMQVGARFNCPPRQHGPQQRGHCESPCAVTRARAAAAELALFIPGQMGTKWPFMPPKDPIVIEMRMHEWARFYRRFLDVSEMGALLSCVGKHMTPKCSSPFIGAPHQNTKRNFIYGALFKTAPTPCFTGTRDMIGKEDTDNKCIIRMRYLLHL